MTFNFNHTFFVAIIVIVWWGSPLKELSQLNNMMNVPGSFHGDHFWKFLVVKDISKQENLLTFLEKKLWMSFLEILLFPKLSFQNVKDLSENR